MIKFKIDRLEVEFARIDRRLQHILYWLDGWIQHNTSCRMIKVTDLFRTQEEQEAIYGEETKIKSVHQFRRGADISVLNFLALGLNPQEISGVINNEFPYGDGRHSTSIYHEVNGRGKHIHIQVRA